MDADHNSTLEPNRFNYYCFVTKVERYNIAGHIAEAIPIFLFYTDLIQLIRPIRQVTKLNVSNGLSVTIVQEEEGI
jgi:hypothetical protein